MSIVAISETAGSLGNDIGRRVAATRGWEFADREIIAQAAERYGESVLELTHAAEEKPGLWERLADSQRRYVAYIQAVLLETAARDDVVLSGRAATILLGDVRHALRVRITAPVAVRAQRVRDHEGLTDEGALEYVRQTDRERAARVRFLYRVDWDDPLLYDVVLNTERITVERGARLILELLQDERYRATDLSRRATADRSLAAQATAALLADPDTRGLGLAVACADGHARLTGSVGAPDERDAAERVVAGVPGVRSVTADAVAVLRRSSIGV